MLNQGMLPEKISLMIVHNHSFLKNIVFCFVFPPEFIDRIEKVKC